MTSILALPLVNIAASIGSDEDWIDGIAYADATGAPIDLTGIAFVLAIAPVSTPVLTASTANGMLKLVQGPGANVPNVLLVSIPAASKAALTLTCYALAGTAIADGHTLDVITGVLSIARRPG